MLFQQCHLDGKGQKEGEIKQGWWAPQTPQVGDRLVKYSAANMQYPSRKRVELWTECHRESFPGPEMSRSLWGCMWIFTDWDPHTPFLLWFLPFLNGTPVTAILCTSHHCYCGVGEDSWESLGLQGDQTSQSYRKSTLNIHWQDWCWSWNSNTLAILCQELTHWKRP